LKPPFRSRGDLLALVDRACAIDAEFATESDRIVNGRMSHADAYDLLNKLCGCLTGASLADVQAAHRHATAQAAAAAVRARAEARAARQEPSASAQPVPRDPAQSEPTNAA
jgi:hypothetical protein